jgi:hypothetical protein
MTHEAKPNAEAKGGPEYTHNLPDACDVPEFEDVEESLASPLVQDLED